MVNLDQAILIFQMILAQYEDKTWGDICEIFDVKANEEDKDIKLSNSYINQLYYRGFVIDSEQSKDYLIRFDERYIEQFVFCCRNKVENISINIEKILSIISFEDKV